MKASLAARVFGEGGMLARAHAGFELRPGQIKMSQAVGEAIARSHHLLMEAPTGTGKTFAYLVPAVESGRKVVVSTGTKNLQEQLFFKDLPRLEQVLGHPIPAAYMKGRDNYLCIKRAREFSVQPVFEEIEELELHRQAMRWAVETATGDRGELADLPERLRFWDRISARADTCLGQKCPDFDGCFLTQMRRRAAEAQVVVVNHHLLMADLLLKNHAFGQVIPEYSVLIVDEAHALEDVATAHLGRSISFHKITELADDLDRALPDPNVQRRTSALRAAAKAFMGLFSSQEGRFPLEPYRHDDLWLAAGRKLREEASLCESLSGPSGAALPDDSAAGNLAGRAAEMAATMALILDPSRAAADSGLPLVTWGEARGRGLTLQASPINVAEPLREMLFSRIPAVVLTSATLAISGGFEFVRGRLGVDSALDLILESPFDPAAQAVLFLPKGMPEPKEVSFLPKMVEQVQALLSITSGRAFILFTSFNNLKRVREALAGSVPYPLLVQGDASRHALLERFRATPNSVLLATASFWHGVDVQGDALSLVVIDKLPFDVPSDPIVAARIESIRSKGGNPFTEYQIPAAVMDLKQGLGRLLRSRKDRGVLSVMDSRLLTRPYGRVFIDSLPPYRIIHDLESVRDFFNARA